MAEKETHITVTNLTMAYGSFVVMRDLSFIINRGDIFIIIGGSGCGKSTLMKIMIGLKAPAIHEDCLRKAKIPKYRTFSGEVKQGREIRNPKQIRMTKNSNSKQYDLEKDCIDLNCEATELMNIFCAILRKSE